LLDIAFDVYIGESGIELIECNMYKDSDKCFFEDEDLEKLKEESLGAGTFFPPFKYRYSVEDIGEYKP
jgi:hypothetical protein